MRNRIPAAVVFLLLLAPSALGGDETEEKPVIATLDPKLGRGVDEEPGDIVWELEYQLIDIGTWYVLDRSQRDVLLEEQAFSLMDCANTACAVEVGKLVSAHYVLRSRVGVRKNRIVTTLMLVSVETGEIVEVGRATADSMEEAVAGAVADLQDQLRGVELSGAQLSRRGLDPAEAGRAPGGRAGGRVDRRATAAPEVDPGGGPELGGRDDGPAQQRRPGRGLQGALRTDRGSGRAPRGLRTARSCRTSWRSRANGRSCTCCPGMASGRPATRRSWCPRA